MNRHENPILEAIDQLIDLSGATGCSTSAARSSETKWIIKMQFLTKEDAQKIGRILRKWAAHPRQLKYDIQEITIRHQTHTSNWLMTADWVLK